MSRWTKYVERGEMLAEHERLLKDRARFRSEMRKVIACKTKKQKLALWTEWKTKYGHNEFHIKELVNCARNKQVAMDIANWKLEGET